MKLDNPHDKFFKETFGDLTVAKDFLHHYVPANIRQLVDIQSLEPQKDSFIDEKLKEGFSDLLFKANYQGEERYLYFLFEHKSYPSQDIILQLLKYMTKIWETKVKKEHKMELPIIIPLVIYHCKSKWNAPLCLIDMMQGNNNKQKQLKRYIPNFEYLLFDLTVRSDEEIRGASKLRIYMTIVREFSKLNPQNLSKVISKAIHYLNEIDNLETGIEYLQTMMKYIFSVYQHLSEEDYHGVVE